MEQWTHKYGPYRTYDWTMMQQEERMLTRLCILDISNMINHTNEKQTYASNQLDQRVMFVKNVSL
jgi:hypothetical protein